MLRGLGISKDWDVSKEGEKDGLNEDEAEKKKRRVDEEDELDEDTEGPNVFWPFTSHLALVDRRVVYGRNVLASRVTKTLLQLMWLALKDKVLVLLSIAAVISLALGLFQDFGTPVSDCQFSCGEGKTCTEPPVDWVEGVAIMVAVVIMVGVGSVNDWQKERQFKALNDRKEDRTVKVVRAGGERVINVKVRCKNYFIYFIYIQIILLLGRRRGRHCAARAGRDRALR